MKMTNERLRGILEASKRTDVSTRVYIKKTVLLDKIEKLDKLALHYYSEDRKQT